VFFVVACTITAVVQKELTAIFVAAGVLGVFVFRSSPPPVAPHSSAPPPTMSPPALAVGLAGAVGGGMTVKLFAFFFKTGLLVFGSGLVIVPFLKTYVVDEYHWLGNRQFLDAVAIGMISPGPVVITATFVGYLLAGLPGAIAATAGIFSPAVLFTLFATPILRRYRANRGLSGFIRGVTVAVVGVLAGTTYLVAKTAVGDWLTLAITLASLTVIGLSPKLPEPLLVGVGAVIGLIAYPLLLPSWVLG
jgi:chromate transporter